ncbi:MAG: histidine kinase [Telluria sp.]
MATALDTDAERPPSDKLFAAWAVLTALIGLPLSHLFLYAASMVQPFSTSPLIEKYLPEMFIVVKVAITYWRLVIIRLWFERLASEKLKRQAAEQGQALAETRLNLLEAQIEPHFLFNTLTSVQHLVRHDAVQADRLLVQLVSYLRQAIPDLRASASTLGRECELVRTYLAIVHMRVGERLAVDVQCPPQIGEAAFPALVLHTLVENAIKHGVEMTPGPVSISVRARHRVQGEQESIEVSVQDNGTGMGKAHEGVGLGNIRDRLALAYGPRAQLDITDAPGGGACITVRIPVSGLVGVL